MPIELILELVLAPTLIKKGSPNRIWVEMGHYKRKKPACVYEIHADVPKFGRYKASRIKIPVDGKTWVENFYHTPATGRLSRMAEFAVNAILQELPRNVIFKKKLIIASQGVMVRVQF